MTGAGLRFSCAIHYRHECRWCANSTRIDCTAHWSPLVSRWDVNSVARSLFYCNWIARHETDTQFSIGPVHSMPVPIQFRFCWSTYQLVGHYTVPIELRGVQLARHRWDSLISNIRPVNYSLNCNAGAGKGYRDLFYLFPDSLAFIRLIDWLIDWIR